MSAGFKLVAALLFVVVTPRAVMGEVFEAAGTPPVHVDVASAAPGSTVLDGPLASSEPASRPEARMAAEQADDASRSDRPKGEPEGPSKPRWAIPRKRHLGRELSGTAASIQSPEIQGQPDPVGGSEPPKRERASSG